MRTLIRLLLLLPLSLTALVEDSVFPRYDEIQDVDALYPARYSNHHFNQIKRALEHKDQSIRVMTFNMLDAQYDYTHENIFSWHYRLPRVVELIRHDRPDIIIDQELSYRQARNVIACLGDTYDFFGIPQTDGETKGEVNGIFWLKNRFELIEKRVWFMSKTPDEISVGPFVKRPRTLTMVQLNDLVTGKTTAYFSTHLNFGSINAREWQAHFVARVVEEFAKEMPVVVGGDFNTFPNLPDIDLPAYSGYRFERILTSGSLEDARLVSLLGHLGPISTFTNNPNAKSFGPFQGTGTPGVILDHLYVNNRVVVLVHATEPARVNRYYPSDHMPVIADLLIRDRQPRLLGPPEKGPRVIRCDGRHPKPKSKPAQAP